MAHPALSAIPTPPSATPPLVQNPQTLQQFLSPLYILEEGVPEILSQKCESVYEIALAHTS